eukprot:6259009-Lingulodinium_polyedra.AAC.1
MLGGLALRIESHAARVVDVDDGQESRDARAILALAAHRRATGAAATKGHGGALYRTRWREHEFRAWLDTASLRKRWLSPGRL